MHLPEAKSVEQVFPDVFRWEVFSPQHKVDLTSHAVRINGHLYIFDPIPLAATAMEQLKRLARSAVIVITSENHERAARHWQSLWRLPLSAAADAPLSVNPAILFRSAEHRWLDWTLFRVSGGARGEMAFFWPQRSLMVLGDAVTNLPDWGLMISPEKYCLDQATLRHSLRQLIATPFQQAIMAHGKPLRERASLQIAAMLDNQP